MSYPDKRTFQTQPDLVWKFRFL